MSDCKREERLTEKGSVHPYGVIGKQLTRTILSWLNAPKVNPVAFLLFAWFTPGFWRRYTKSLPWFSSGPSACQMYIIYMVFSWAEGTLPERSEGRLVL